MSSKRELPLWTFLVVASPSLLYWIPKAQEYMGVRPPGGAHIGMLYLSLFAAPLLVAGRHFFPGGSRAKRVAITPLVVLSVFTAAYTIAMVGWFYGIGATRNG